MTTIHSLSTLLSTLLIIVLIAPSVSLAMEDGASSDSSGPSDAASGGSGREESMNAGEGSGSEAGDAAEAEAEANNEAASDAAAEFNGAGAPGTSATASTNGSGEVDVSLSDGSTVSVDANDPAAMAGAQSALEAMAAASNSGVQAATGNTAGVNARSTFEGHMNGSLAPGEVVGNLSNERGTPQEVGRAEITHAGRVEAVDYASTFNTDRFQNNSAAPAVNVNDALSIAMANRAQINTTQTTPTTRTSLMNPTPLSQQTVQLSTNLNNVNISQTPVTGVAPTQSFSTTNPTINATNFTLGNFAPSLSIEPPNSTLSVSDQYSQAALGTAVGRLSTIQATLEDRLDELTTNVDYFTDTQIAQITDVQAQIAALDARRTAMVDPTVANQAVAALQEQKADEVSAIANEVAAQERLGQTNVAANTLDYQQSRIAAYDTRISAARANPTTAALTEVINNSRLAALDVDVALGVTPAPTYATAPTPSAVANLGINLGLNPTTANAVAANVNAVVDGVVNAVPGLATASAMRDYVNARARAREVDMPAQATLDALTAAGVADPYGQLTPQERNQISSATTLDVQVSALGSRAIGVAMMDFMGIATAVPGLRSMAVMDDIATPSVVSRQSANTSTSGSRSVAPASTVDNTAPTSNVTMSYDYTTNTVTVSSPRTTTASVVEGRLNTTGRVAANDNVTTTPNTGVARTAANDNVPTSQNTTASTPGYRSTTQQNPASRGVAANNNTAPSTVSPDATAPSSLTDNVATPATTVDTAAVPGVTRRSDSFLGTTESTPSSVTTRNVTTAALALVELASASLNPATMARTFANSLDNITAITRTASDINPSAPTTVAVRTADNLAPAPVTQTTPTATTRTSGAVTNSTVAPTAVSAVPIAAVPATQTPATQTQTPSTQVAANPEATTQPAVTTEAGPSSYTAVEQAAPAVTQNPISRALTTVGDSIATGINEVLGVRPAASQPIGVTQNNPTNIRERGPNNAWVGEVNDGVKTFETFTDPEHGFRAAYLIQQSYQEAGVTTVRERIERATPAFENPNQATYINNVASHMGIDPDTSFDIMDKDKAIAYMEAVTVEEVGVNQFTREQMEAGFELALAGSQNPSVANTNIATATVAPAPQVVQDLVQIARGAAELSPTVIAARTAFRFLDRILTQPAQQPSPVVITTTQSVTPVAVERVVLANQNATYRKQPIVDTLQDQLDYAAKENGVTFVVTSGGQATRAEVTSGLAKLTDRTGSTRHDHGNAADGYLQDPVTGRVLDFTNPNDRPVFESFIEDAVKAGVTGVGAGVNYMGGNTIHVGGGSPLAWGAKGKTANAPAWLTAAHQRGLSAAQNFDLAAHRAAQQTTPSTIPVTLASTQPSTPTVTPSTNAQTPITSVAEPNTISQVAEPASPSRSTPDNSRVPATSGQDTPSSVSSGNLGTPPNNLGNVGAGTSPTPNSLNAVERASLAVYGAVAAIVAVLANVLGDDPETDTEIAGPIENPTTPPSQGSPSSGTPVSPTTQNTDDSSQPDMFNPNISDHTATSSKPIINVLIQIDGDTGDTYFDVDGVYDSEGQLVVDYTSYGEIEPENEIDAYSDFVEPRIILDDQGQDVVYSDGTYAPIVVNGVWYESVDDPRYVYTVEYYQNGELVEVAENAGALPEGNPLSNLLNSLFADTGSYQLSDVNTITRALIDPNNEIPADEYYIYRVYLTNGEVRGTTVPEFTSYRFMNERFIETGFIGNTLSLIAGAVDIPPPSTGRVTSKIVETLKNVGLSALDLFRSSDEDDNPVVTDFGTIIPSDDGEINMKDIQSVLVLLDVEAECPFVPGLTRPYLYEIVIARGAISGATSDQAFRAVRCGGGEKQDFVDQVANHFETFDGVGTLDRQQLSEMIRFSAFQDLDMTSLIEETTEVTVSIATSTPATVPEATTTTAEEQSFKPNVTNEITFEVKAVGSQGQTLTDWTSTPSVSINSGSQLHFRWNGTAYQQCLPFLNDNGNYSLTVRNQAMTTGNTETEQYNVTEYSGVYKIECGGQRNNEFGVDNRSIEVTVE